MSDPPLAEQAGARALRGVAGATLPWVVLAVMLPASVWLFVVLRESIESVARLRFERQASDIRYVIEARIGAYAEIMYGLQALLSTRDSVSRLQFHRYVASLDLARRYPGYDVVNYAVHVRRDELAAFERGVREDTSLDPGGYPAFSVRPPGDRPDYFVIVYVEPMQGFEFAFGLDLAANTAVAGADNRMLVDLQHAARDSGRLTASGRPIRIRRGGRDYTGLAVRLAVYRSGMPVASVGERRAAYLGSVGAGFSIDAVMQGVLDAEAGRYMGFSVHDTGAIGDGPRSGQGGRRLLFDSTGRADSAGHDAPEPDSGDFFSSVLPLEFAGRHWEVRFRARKDAIIDRIDAVLPWLILCGGILSSLLLSGMIYSLASSRGRALVLAREMTSTLRHSEQELRDTTEQLTALSRRLVDVQEHDRRQFSRELHDRVGQNLTALSISVDILKSELAQGGRDDLLARIDDAAGLLESTAVAIENVMSELRPPMLDDYGLLPALQWYADGFSLRTGVKVGVRGDESNRRLALSSEIALFRIVQEALNNVAKHARAGRVEVSMEWVDSEFVVAVSDDGVGIAEAQPEGARRRIGLGMVNMRERAQAIGGRLEIGSRPGGGTRVCVRVAA